MGAHPHPLRRWRKERGLTLRDLSHLTGLDIGTISRAERGLSVPSWQTKVRLARSLRVPLGNLFDPPLARNGQP